MAGMERSREPDSRGWLVCWGCMRSAPTSSMWKGSGTNADFSAHSGCAAPNVTRSERSLRALTSMGCKQRRPVRMARIRRT